MRIGRSAVATVLVAMAMLGGVAAGQAAAGSSHRETAVEEFARLREEAHAARVAGDKQARLEAVLKIRKLVNDAPDGVEASAEAYAQAGDTQKALAALNEFADLGQADEAMVSGKSQRFAALKNLPEYAAILKRFEENRAPVSRAEKMLDLPDADLIAEDVDYDPQSDSFLITSVRERKIVRVGRDGKTKDFAASPSHWPMMAIKVDAPHKRLWATEVAVDGFTAVPKAEWGRSAVLCFDLGTGALRLRVEGPAKAALGDMVLTRDGDPIVSDGQGGGVYRVKGDQLVRIDGGDFISPQTATMHPDGRHVFVPDYVRGIGVLDLETKQVTWLKQGQHAMNGIDGLYFNHGWLIATQNGDAPERVIRFKLDEGLSGIVSEEIIERATATLGDPTHGVIVGDFFYYIANSGWTEVDDQGEVKPNGKLTPAKLMRFRLAGKSR
jgi:hypothetical protein